jgi:type VI secretion system protein VasJ
MADTQTTTQPGMLTPLLEGVRRPIPGNNPCGRDISYEEDFLAVKAEIDKMSTVSGQVDQERAAELRQMMDTARGTVRKADRTEAEKQLDQRASVVKQTGGPDYQFIRQTSGTILAEKSKDIRIAGYLCYALWKLESFTGLAEGLSAIETLFREFWDGLYPAKTRLAARKGALDFLAAKLDENIAYTQVQQSDRSALERAQATLKNLQEQFREKMPENPPSLMGLLQAVEKCLNKVPRPAETSKPGNEAKEVAQSTDAAAPTSRSNETSKPAPSSPGELRTVPDAMNLVRQAGRFMREQNPRSATPYRLSRSLQWDPLVNLPPNENGKTRFQAPPAQDRSLLANLRESKNWPRLLEQCEVKFNQMGFHVWLDMQRFAVEAVDGLGPEFSTVRAGIIAELSLLLQRVPNLPALTFADGTRFADPATAGWIEETLSTMPGPARTHDTRPPGAGDETEDQIDTAKQMFAAGDLAGAIGLLSSAQPDTSRKAFFRRKLAMANLCMRGGQPSIARPLLEELDRDIERFSIHDWEPRLALEAWTALHACYQTLTAGPATPAKQALQQQGEKVFERICRLDTTFALAAAGIKPMAKRPTATSAAGQAAQPMDGGSNGTHDMKETTT